MQDLETHKEIYDGVDRIYICPPYAKNFESKWIRKKHVKNHTAEKRFKYAHCGMILEMHPIWASMKGFTLVSSLIRVLFSTKRFQRHPFWNYTRRFTLAYTSTLVVIVIKCLDIHRHVMLIQWEYIMALQVMYVTSATNILTVALIITGMSGCTQAKSHTAALSATNNFLIRQVFADSSCSQNWQIIQMFWVWNQVQKKLKSKLT